MLVSRIRLPYWIHSRVTTLHLAVPLILHCHCWWMTNTVLRVRNERSHWIGVAATAKHRHLLLLEKFELFLVVLLEFIQVILVVILRQLQQISEVLQVHALDDFIRLTQHTDFQRLSHLLLHSIRPHAWIQLDHSRVLVYRHTALVVMTQFQRSFLHRLHLLLLS